MSTHRKMLSAALVMSFATFASRVSGLIRDVVIARLFGAGMTSDAFFMAFTIPNLLRRFFAEGSLTAAFVPVFSDIFHQRGEIEAQRFANRCVTLLLLIMLVVVTLGLLFSPWIVTGIGYGFGQTEGKLQLTHQLNMVMFPYIAPVSILALLTGVLNVRGHFFLPSLSPLFLNLAMILGAVCLGSLFSQPVYGLATGVLLGGVLQLLVQVPALTRYRIRFCFDFHFLKDPQVQKVLMLMLPGVAGVAIYQINVVVTRLLASFLPEGSVSYLYYGQRLFEFPQGIFIVALAQAALPMMSEQIARHDREGMQQSLQFALTLIVLMTLPATVGLILCAVPIYSLLFMGGEFSLADLENTALALMFFAPGLVFVGCSRIAAQTFYAMKDTRTPVVISFWTLLVNLVAGVALMFPLGFVGLALALTLASAFNAAALLLMLQRRIQLPLMSTMIRQLLRIVPACAVMAVAVFWLLGLTDWNAAGQTLQKSLILGGAIVAGALLYAGSCLVLGVDELRQFVRFVKSRREVRPPQ